MDGEESKKSFPELIKDQILKENIKMECCKSSFLCGTEVFARRNKNMYSDALSEFTEKLKNRRKKDYFGSPQLMGYVKAEKNGLVFPTSSGRVCENCLKHLLQGAFMVAGRANEKDGSFSVEMVMPNSITGEIVGQMLSDIGIPPKHTVRRGEEILYFRKNETVGDMLLLIGAYDAFYDMQYEARINGYKSSANRQKNCDATNVRRAVEAAGRQIEAIKAIERNEGLEALSKTLRETAVLRLENPIEPLDGLVSAVGGNISKSGINHRLCKIVEYAENKGYIEKL